MITTTGPWCCCGCPYFTEEFRRTPIGSQSLVTGRWSVSAGTWTANYVNTTPGWTAQGYMQTSSTNSLVLCEADDWPTAREKRFISFRTPGIPIDNQLYVYFAYKDSNNWARLEVKGVTGVAVNTPNPCPAVDFWELKITVNNAGSSSQVGATFYHAMTAYNESFPGTWALTWDGATLGVFVHNGDTPAAWNSLYTPNIGMYSFPVPGVPSGCYRFGFGFGALSHGTYNYGRINGRIYAATTYDHDTDCYRLPKWCDYCGSGQYPTSWDLDFIGVNNDSCTECGTYFDSVTYSATRGYPPPYLTFGGAECNRHPHMSGYGGRDVWPSPFLDKFRGFNSGNCYYGSVINGSDTLTGPNVTGICSGNIYSILFKPIRYDSNYVGTIPSGWADKTVLQASLIIKSGFTWVFGPYWESNPITDIDCTGTTTYTLNYVGGDDGKCNWPDVTIEATPVGGTI